MNYEHNIYHDRCIFHIACACRFMHPRNPTLALAKLETETANRQVPCARKVKGQVASSVAK